MTKAEATRAAKKRVSQVYRTEAGKGSVMWGFSVDAGADRQGYRAESSIGTYREAVAARREWIADQVARTWERCHVGDTDRCAFKWAEAEARRRAGRLNALDQYAAGRVAQMGAGS